MKPTEELIAEHDVIKRAIDVMEKANKRLEEGDDSVASVYPEIVDFIRQFADSCHHGKEEDILFNVMKERGVPADGPLAFMLAEHDRGREYVRNLSAAADRFLKGDESARAEIVMNAAGYADLLKNHIYKEDFVLYPMADKILTSQDQENLTEEFKKVEKNFGPKRRHQYEELVDRLEDELAS